MAATATRLFIAVPPTVTRGVPFAIEVRALDASSMVVTDYTGTVHFTANTPGLTLPADYTFTPADQGRHTFSVTASEGGSGWINVWDGTIGGSSQFTIVCGLEISVTNDGPACPGRGVTLHASANMSGVTFQWQHIPGNLRPGNGDTYVNAEAGQWKVYGTTEDGCSAEATTFVDTHAVPEPVFVRPQSICGNSATVTLQNASSFTNLVWFAENATIASGQGTSTIELTATPAASSGGMWVRLEANAATSSCFVATTAFAIAVNETASTSITTPAAACARTTVTASVPDAGPGATYTWSIANGTIASGQGTRTITWHADSSADVTLGTTITNPNCTTSGTAVVSVDGPTANVDGTFSSCDDADITVPVTLAGVAPFRIVWSDGVVQENIATASTTRTFGAAESGSFWIMDISDANCSGSSSGIAEVVRPAAPAITDQPDSTTIAPAQTATLRVAASGDGVFFRWYEGTSGDRSKLVAVELAPTFTTPKLTRTTQYWVEAMNGCTAAASQTATVTVAAGKRRAARH